MKTSSISEKNKYLIKFEKNGIITSYICFFKCESCKIWFTNGFSKKDTPLTSPDLHLDESKYICNEMKCIDRNLRSVLESM